MNRPKTDGQDKPRRWYAQPGYWSIAGLLLLAAALGAYLIMPSRDMVVGEIHRPIPIPFDGQKLGLDGKSLDDFNLLLVAGCYSGRATGYTGQPSESYLAFVRLLRRKDATAVFTALAEHSLSAGKLYALAALKVLSPDLYARYLSRIQNDHTPVYVQRGCVITHSTLAETPIGLMYVEQVLAMSDEEFHLRFGGFAEEEVPTTTIEPASIPAANQP